MVNTYLGVQIWPGEVEDLPEDLIMGIKALVNGLPQVRVHNRKVEDYLTKWRNSHPTYGKR